MPRPVLFLAALAIAIASATPVRAHTGEEAFILVPYDHLVPGQPFDIIASDLAPDSPVVLRLARDKRAEVVGELVSGADGHFTATAMVPADFPTGYAQVFARDGDGTEVSTWVLIGERNDEVAAPAIAAGEPWWTDPSVIVLGLLVGGGLVGFGVLIMRSQRQKSNKVRRPSRS